MFSFFAINKYKLLSFRFPSEHKQAMKYTTTVTLKNDNSFIDSTFRLYLGIIRNEYNYITSARVYIISTCNMI